MLSTGWARWRGPRPSAPPGRDLTLTPPSPSRYQLIATHAYAEPGIYEVTITVVDQAYNTDAETVSCSIAWALSNLNDSETVTPAPLKDIVGHQSRL
jgi:hypothetical protein